MKNTKIHVLTSPAAVERSFHRPAFWPKTRPVGCTPAPLGASVALPSRARTERSQRLFPAAIFPLAWQPPGHLVSQSVSQSISPEDHARAARCACGSVLFPAIGRHPAPRSLCFARCPSFTRCRPSSTRYVFFSRHTVANRLGRPSTVRRCSNEHGELCLFRAVWRTNYVVAVAPDLRDAPPLPLHIWPQVTNADAAVGMLVLLL